MRKTPEFDELIFSVFQNAPYAILSFKSLRDKAGKIVDFECLFMNPKASEITQLSMEEMIGNTLLKTMPGHTEIGLFEKYCHVVETGETLSFNQFYEGKHGNYWFEIHASKLGDGFTASVVDSTTLQNSLKEREEANIRYEQLFHESIDSIFITNNELLFLEASDSMIHTFGYPREVTRNMSLKNLFLNEQDFIRFNLEFYKNDRIEEFEAELVYNSGKSAICLINIIELSQSNDGIRLFQGIIKDITERKRAERELLWAEKLTMTGKIARSIAHEVRNPLTNLSLALDQLKDELPQNLPDADLYISIIQRSSDRISNLITELLESSKPKALKLTKSSLNSVVSQSVNLVKDKLKQKGMKLKESYDRYLPPIPLDNDQISTALLNLFINAIEAMKTSQGCLSINTYQHNGQACLEIKDNGRGIPKEDMSSLFEPFFTAKRGGMGLGLTMVQNIIKSHTGQISAESTPGKGTAFTISFPFN